MKNSILGAILMLSVIMVCSPASAVQLGGAGYSGGEKVTGGLSTTQYLTIDGTSVLKDTVKMNKSITVDGTSVLTGKVGIGTTTLTEGFNLNGRMVLAETSTPTTPEATLYNVAGKLWWGNVNLSGGGSLPDYGNAGGIPISSGAGWVRQDVSGDLTINSSGVTAIGAGKIQSSMIANSAVTSGAVAAGTYGIDISGNAATADNADLATNATNAADSALLNGNAGSYYLNAGNINAGTLPVGRGGTGTTTFTAGSVIFSDGTNLTQDNSNLYWNNTNDRLGIGTITPAGAISVKKYTGLDGIVIESIKDSGFLALGAVTTYLRGKGGTAEVTPLTDGTSIGGNLFGGYFNATEYGVGAAILGRAAQNYASGKLGTDLTFHTTVNDGSTVVQRMIIQDDGKVGINTDTPAEMLDVVGNASIEGYVNLQAVSAPDPTTARLYNEGGALKWNGINLSGGGSIPAPVDGKILVSDATPAWAAVTMAGDVTISNAGSTTIGDNKVTEGMLATGSVTGDSLAKVITVTGSSESDIYGITFKNTGTGGWAGLSSAVFFQNDAGLSTMAQINQNHPTLAGATIIVADPAMALYSENTYLATYKLNAGNANRKLVLADIDNNGNIVEHVIMNKDGILQVKSLPASLFVKTTADQKLTAEAINISTDSITGTLPIANGGTGTTTFTAGSVVFSDGTGLTQNNEQLFFSDAPGDARLGIGIATPVTKLHVNGGALTISDPGLFGAYINLGSTTPNPTKNANLSLIWTGGSSEAGSKVVGLYQVVASENWAGGGHGTTTRIFNTSRGDDSLNMATTKSFVFDDLGQVHIGFTTGQFDSLASDEALDVNGRVRLARVAAPVTTTDKLYNVAGALTWNGINLSAGGAMPAAVDGKMIIADATPAWTAVTLSGDLTTSNTGVTAIGTNKVTEAMLATDSVTTDSIKAINVTAAKVALADAKVLIGSGVGGAAAEQTLSGDITMSNTGVTTIGTNKVTEGMIADSAVTGDSIAASAVDLTTKVTGTLPIAKGGTNNTAFDNNAVVYSAGGALTSDAATLKWDGSNLMLNYEGADPNATLGVFSEDGNTIRALSNYAAGSVIYLQRVSDGGTPASYEAVGNNAPLGVLAFGGASGHNELYNNGAIVGSLTTQAWSGSGMGAKLYVITTPNNATNPDLNHVLQMNNDSKVGIGYAYTYTPLEQLDVNGRVRLEPTSAPDPTTNKLYNVGGALTWNGINLSGGGAIPAPAVAGNILIDSGAAWISNDVEGDVTISSVGGTTIGTNKVTEAMLATDSVTTDSIKDANVTTAKIAVNNITEALLATDSVTTDSIKDAAVTSAKLATGLSVANLALAQGKIIIGDDAGAAAAQTPAGDVTIAVNGTTTIGTNKVTEGMLATDSVTTDSIKDANVTTAKIAVNNITEALLATDSVTADSIAASAVVLTSKVSGILPIANGGTNNSAAYTAGSVVFANGTSLTQDNDNLFWDNSTKKLGIGTKVPTQPLDVQGATRLGGALTVTGDAAAQAALTVTGKTTANGTVEVNNSFVLKPAAVKEISDTATSLTAADIQKGTVWLVSDVDTKNLTDGIAAGQSGQMLFLAGTSDTLLVKVPSTATNCKLSAGVDFTLGSGDSITFMYVGTISKWVEVSRSDN